MKLKLDLHPIYNDTRRIEDALQTIIDDALAQRATEVEIIPGKGSGALKKTVLRFLERPEIKARYHRVEKDGDNWGRLFVHFRHERPAGPSSRIAEPARLVSAPCACCTEAIATPEPEDGETVRTLLCPSCASPNRLTFRRDRRGIVHTIAELDYSGFSA